MTLQHMLSVYGYESTFNMLYKFDVQLNTIKSKTWNKIVTKMTTYHEQYLIVGTKEHANFVAELFKADRTKFTFGEITNESIQQKNDKAV